MVIALVYALILTVIVMAMAYFIASETRSVGFLLDDTKAMYLAQAGVERAFREIRDEVITPPQSGVADLRGATTSGTAGTATTRNYVRYYNEGSVLTVPSRTTTGSYVILSYLDNNYIQTKILNVKIGCRYSKSGSGGTNPILEILYTTNGGFPQAGNSSFTTTVTSTTYNASPFIVLDITGDRAWAWSLINNVGFQIRASGYYSSNSGNRDIRIDYLFLQVTYAVDTNTEPWYAGTYDTFPKVLGDGFIQSVSIVDEARKVNLNSVNLATPASSLLRYLMQERGIPSATASTLATAIRTYRGNTTIDNPFDSVEELQRVTGMTAAYYNLIKDYVTVYSFTNTYTQRPVGNPWYRAPININTAPPEVLRAIFDPILGTSLSATLADDIDTRRTTIAPFTCFYNSNPLVTTDFYDFVKSRTYAGFTDTLKNRILDNADASTLVPVSGAIAFTGVTTEFCYANTTYKIESVGKITVPGQVTSDINLRVTTIVGNDGSRVFPVYANQPQSAWKGYWKENYE